MKDHKKNKSYIIKKILDHFRYFGSKDRFEQNEVIENGRIRKFSYILNKYRMDR